ncbi:MAG: LamG domain-containing protein, partial [Planctomycetes bacterium]|nr:LamG domain-containing protein [Planctomycetota bacterium]
MIKRLSIAVVVVLVSVQGTAAEQDGLVGCWDFDEGTGGVLRDSSGHGNHGEIHGPQWVKSGAGHALRFDGADDYVDCGNDASLDLRGPMTLAAWVHPLTASAREPGIVGKFFDSYALTLYRGGCWWYISGGGNNASAPLLKTGCWHHVAGTFDGHSLRLYVNGHLAAQKKSKAKSVTRGNGFQMGRIVPNPEAPDAASHARGHFEGLLDDVKVYSRPLSLQEVITAYNEEAVDKGREPRDTSWFGRFRLKPYHYPEKGRLVVEVDYLGLLPMAQGSQVVVELMGPDDDEAVATREIGPNPDHPTDEVAFSLAEVSPGNCEVRAVLIRGDTRDHEETITFVHPRPAQRLPHPEEKLTAALPPPKPPVAYEFSPTAGGGFSIRIKGVAYPIESSYSFPHGGKNRLTVENAPDAGGEAAWQVATHRLDDEHYQATAHGEHYAIDRRITLKANHVLIEDTFTNTGRDVVGIILSNHVDTRGGPVASVEMPKNFTFFVSATDHGLGVVGLDDVYQLQQETHFRGGVAAMTTDKFGLAPGASYTVQWAVYPTAGDYFDFINALRKNEGLNRTVEGAFGLVGDGEGLVTAEHRRVPPSPKEIEAEGVKYVSFFYLIAPADDPGMSLEGIEFTEYPMESALLKKTIAETHALNPGVKVMFHIAHGLYATNRPETLFPDSRVIDAQGNQVLYGPNSADYYCRYFSRERFDEGHRWWIFYPTMENSFGKAMLEAIDYMLEDIGATAMYADGFVSGYARGYTYDTWDGHSVEIDPGSYTVRRKMGNVTLMALPVLKAVARKVAAKGGVVITNGQAGPRSLWKEHYFTTCETSGGDQLPISRLHVGPTVTAFGDPQRIKSRRDLYRDVLDKLNWGALYFYYGDRNYAVDERMLVRHMYPFTLQELHAGWMKGKERFITRVAGVYGWPGDRRLHRVYRSDARGALVANTDFSTADAAGVRTQLHLDEMESAVVEKIPVELLTTRPVNFLVTEYDER